MKRILAGAVALSVLAGCEVIPVAGVVALGAFDKLEGFGAPFKTVYIPRGESFTVDGVSYPIIVRHVETRDGKLVYQENLAKVNGNLVECSPACIPAVRYFLKRTGQ